MNVASSNQDTGAAPLTLGDLLYADPAIARVTEKDWLQLIRAMAAGEEAALRLLYEKTYPIVFAYLIRLTADRELTRELMLDVYQDIWCEAPVFDGTQGPVLGWIMRLARASARAGSGAASGDSSREVAPAEGDLSTDTTLSAATDRQRPAEDPRVRAALETLTMHEREAIEATVLNGFTYTELAAQWREPVGTIKSRIRSGLLKLQQALQAGVDES